MLTTGKDRIKEINTLDTLKLVTLLVKANYKEQVTTSLIQSKNYRSFHDVFK